jgi:hypothetical protein
MTIIMDVMQASNGHVPTLNLVMIKWTAAPANRIIADFYPIHDERVPEMCTIPYNIFTNEFIYFY